MTKSPATAPLTVVFVLASAAWALWYFGGTAHVFDVTREDGPVEMTTALLYFAVAAGVWAVRRPADSWRTVAALSAALLAFGAREMDWHKHWTGTSVLKLGFYLERAPLQHKLLGGMAVLAAAAALGYLLLRHAAATWRALRAGEPVAATVACFVALLVVCKVLDRSVNILVEDYQWVISASAHALVSSFEEVLELGLPLLAALGVLQHRRSSRRAQPAQGEPVFSYRHRGRRPTAPGRARP